MLRTGVLLCGAEILPMKIIWKKLFRHLNLVGHLSIQAPMILTVLILTIGFKIA